MQNNDTETYEPIDKKDVDKFRKLGNVIIEVGTEFTLEGQKYRIRKITHKDIICRPVNWKQK